MIAPLRGLPQLYLFLSGVGVALPSSSPLPTRRRAAFAPTTAALHSRRWKEVEGTMTGGKRPSAVRSLLFASSGRRPKKLLSPEESDGAIAPLLNLASAHFASQALLAVVRLGVPDAIGDSTVSIDDIASEISSSRRGGGGGHPDPDAEVNGAVVNTDALLRSMRMLSSAGIFDESFDEDGRFAYSLTAAGALLQKSGKGDGDGDGRGVPPPDHRRQPSLGCCVEHWTERPLWDAWAALPDYVLSGATSEDVPPFESANGVPAAEFYGRHPDSLRHQNDFVRFVSSTEEPAVLSGFDWSSLGGTTVVDVGGHHGAVLGAVKRSFPDVRCISLDLPDVVEMAPDPPPEGVDLIGGDMFDPSTIPPCDAILLRHMLCNFDDETAIQILRNCHSVLPDNGKVIIGDIVLPDAGEATGNDNGRTKIFVDSLMMLVGVRGERIKSQWAALASAAGFRVDSVVSTSSPSCDMMVLV